MDPSENPDGGKGQFDSTQFGTDKNSKTHVQPADLAAASKVMPGEQRDPRLC